MNGHSGQYDQGDGDDRMHDKHQPMPRGRVRAFGLAFHQDAVFVFFADNLGHFFPDGLDTERRTKSMAIPGMQKANPGGLAKCKNRKQNFWLPDLGSNQGPTD